MQSHGLQLKKGFLFLCGIKNYYFRIHIQEMAKNKLTYRILASCFLVLMLLAPVAQAMSHAHVLETQQTEQQDKANKQDANSSSETIVKIASDIQATVSSSIQIKSNWVALPVFLPAIEFIPLNEWSEEVFVNSSSQHYKTICTHFIAPQAP